MSSVCGTLLPKTMGARNADINSGRREASCTKLQVWTSVAVSPRNENLWQPAQACTFSFWNKKNKFGNIKVLNCWLEDLYVDRVLFSSPGSLGSKTEKLCVIKMETVSISCDSQSCGKSKPMRKDCSCPLAASSHQDYSEDILNPLKHKLCKQNIN